MERKIFMVLSKLRVAIGTWVYTWVYAKNPRGYWEQRGLLYFEQEKDELDLHGTVGKRADFLAGEIRKLEVRTVLEVGCGYGAILKPLADLELDTLVGCDFSTTQLGKAQEYLWDKKGRLVYADVTKGLPFEDNSFDLVFTSGVIMHIPPPQDIKAREEIIRVSRKYVMHNESLTPVSHKFGYDNERYYRERGYTVIESKMNPYKADENMQFIIVELNKDSSSGNIRGEVSQ